MNLPRFLVIQATFLHDATDAQVVTDTTQFERPNGIRKRLFGYLLHT